MFLVNSRFPLVTAAPSGSAREALHPAGALLLPKLRRYFAEFLNHSSPNRLGILYLPTCVGLGYGRRANSLEAFLGSMGSVTSSKRLGIASQASWGPDLPGPRPTRLPQDNQRLGSPTLLRPSFAARTTVGRFVRRQPLSTRGLGWTRTRRYWNINQLCIDYASRPRLSSRLTLGGLAFPRNPWAFGGGVSHPSLATHAYILTRPRSTTVHTATSLRGRRSPTTALACNPRLRLWT